MYTTVSVLGAGIMGHGIAYVSVVAGCRTRLYDPSPAALDLAKQRIGAILQQATETGRVTAADADAARERLLLCGSVEEAVRDAEVAIEAAPEQAALKLDLLALVDAAARPDALIATNTSALSITELAAALSNPRRLAGMHFFNPVHKMKLVEVVRAGETAPETIDGIEALARQMGKQPVLVRDSPGFVTSRINALIGNEAFFMLQDGVASARDIDTALKLGLNHPMGPFEMVDLVGLDTRLAVLEFLHRSLGEKYRPCPLLVQYVAEGRLGRKSGRGVYEYDN
jgi:3-hydroxybutyryl-CoA dehydrogenase